MISYVPRDESSSRDWLSIGTRYCVCVYVYGTNRAPTQKRTCYSTRFPRTRRSLLIVRRFYVGKGSTNLYTTQHNCCITQSELRVTRRCLPPSVNSSRYCLPSADTPQSFIANSKTSHALWGAAGGPYTSVFRRRVQTPQYDNIGSVIIRVVKYGIDFGRGLSAGRKVRAAKIACICRRPVPTGCAGNVDLFTVSGCSPLPLYPLRNIHTRLPRICNLFLFKKKKMTNSFFHLCHHPTQAESAKTYKI